VVYDPNVVSIPSDRERFLADELDRIKYELDAQRLDFIQPDEIVSASLVGTPTGSVTDMQNLHDGNVYQLQETAGTPGFYIEMRFSNVKNVKGIVSRIRYAGSSTHNVTMNLYDYENLVYKDLVTLPHNATNYQYRTILLPEERRWISGNKASLNINHSSSGSPSHTLYIGYVGLIGTRSASY